MESEFRRLLAKYPSSLTLAECMRLYVDDVMGPRDISRMIQDAAADDVLCGGDIPISEYVPHGCNYGDI